MDEVQRALNDVTTGLKDTQNAGAQSFEKQGEEAKKTTRTLKDIRTELKGVLQALGGLDAGSDEFVALSQRAGKLKYEINDVSEAVNANAGPAFESAANSAGRLTGQLQSLDFEGASQSAKQLASNVKKINFGELQNGIKAFGSSLATLGKSLLTNPIFLLAAAIGAIVVATLEWRDASLQVDSVLAANLDTQNKIVEARLEEVNRLTTTTEQLKEQGLSQREILNLQKQATNEAITALEVQIATQEAIQKQQVESAKRNKDILTGIIDFITAPLQLILSTIDKIAEFAGQELNLQDQLNDLTASLVFDPEEVEAEGKAAIDAQKKTLEGLEENRARYNNQIKDLDKQERDKRAQDELAEDKRILDERRAAREAFAKKVAELEGQIQQKGIEMAQGSLQVVQQTEFDKFLVKQQAAAAEEQLAAQVRAKEVELAQGALGAISALTEAFAGQGEQAAKRAFQLNKAASIAQAVITTYQGANAIFASAAANPATVLFPAQPFIQAGIAIASGLANVAKIARTKFNDAGGGGGGGAPRPSFGGGASGGSPRAGFTTFGLQDINNRPNQVPRAYVLASDVTTQTEAAEKINDRAKL
jgi:hypothetical protein